MVECRVCLTELKSSGHEPDPVDAVLHGLTLGETHDAMRTHRAAKLLWVGIAGTCAAILLFYFLLHRRPSPKPPHPGSLIVKWSFHPDESPIWTRPSLTNAPQHFQPTITTELVDSEPQELTAPTDDVCSLCVVTAVHDIPSKLAVFQATLRAVMSQRSLGVVWYLVGDGVSPEDASILEETVKAAGQSAAPLRVKVLHYPTPKRLPGARNVALHRCRCTAAMFLDSDDVIAPEFTTYVQALFATSPSTDMVHSWSVGFGYISFLWPHGFEDGELNLYENHLTVHTAFRMRAARAVGLLDESLKEGMEDWNLWLRLMNAGYTGYTIPEYLFWYRTSPPGKWSSLDDPKVKNRVKCAFRNQMPKLYGPPINCDADPDVLADALRQMVKRLGSDARSGSPEALDRQRVNHLDSGAPTTEVGAQTTSSPSGPYSLLLDAREPSHVVQLATSWACNRTLGGELVVLLWGSAEMDPFIIERLRECADAVYSLSSFTRDMDTAGQVALHLLHQHHVQRCTVISSDAPVHCLVRSSLLSAGFAVEEMGVHIRDSHTPSPASAPIEHDMPMGRAFRTTLLSREGGFPRYGHSKALATQRASCCIHGSCSSQSVACVGVSLLKCARDLRQAAQVPGWRICDSRPNSSRGGLGPLLPHSAQSACLDQRTEFCPLPPQHFATGSEGSEEGEPLRLVGVGFRDLICPHPAPDAVPSASLGLQELFSHGRLEIALGFDLAPAHQPREPRLVFVTPEVKGSWQHPMPELLALQWCERSAAGPLPTVATSGSRGVAVVRFPLHRMKEIEFPLTPTVEINFYAQLQRLPPSPTPGTRIHALRLRLRQRVVHGSMS